MCLIIIAVSPTLPSRPLYVQATSWKEGGKVNGNLKDHKRFQRGHINFVVEWNMPAPQMQCLSHRQRACFKSGGGRQSMPCGQIAVHIIYHAMNCHLWYITLRFDSALFDPLCPAEGCARPYLITCQKHAGDKSWTHD